MGRGDLSNLWQWSDGWNQHKIHIFTQTLLPTKSTLELDYTLNTEHVTCNCQCWDELRRHSDKSRLSLRWASADWGRCPRILFVCKSFISSSNFILVTCLVNVSLPMIWKWCIFINDVAYSNSESLVDSIIRIGNLWVVSGRWWNCWHFAVRRRWCSSAKREISWMLWGKWK